MSLRDELEPFASSGREAFTLADRWLAGIIRTLQRDPRIDLTRFEFELLLADDRGAIQQQLFSLLVDRVHLDHVDVVEGVGS
jgi:hypothetical protein